MMAFSLAWLFTSSRSPPCLWVSEGAAKHVFAFRVCRVVLPEPALAEQAIERTWKLSLEYVCEYCCCLALNLSPEMPEIFLMGHEHFAGSFSLISFKICVFLSTIKLRGFIYLFIWHCKRWNKRRPYPSDRVGGKRWLYPHLGELTCWIICRRSCRKPVSSDWGTEIFFSEFWS